MNIRETILQEMASLLKEDYTKVTGDGSPDNPFNEEGVKFSEKIKDVVQVIRNKNLTKDGRKLFFVKVILNQIPKILGIEFPDSPNADNMKEVAPYTPEEAKRAWNYETKEIEKKRQEEEEQKAAAQAHKDFRTKNVKFIILGANWCPVCKLMMKDIIKEKERSQKDPYYPKINYEYYSLGNDNTQSSAKKYPDLLKNAEGIVRNPAFQLRDKFDFSTSPPTPSVLPVTFILEDNNVIGFYSGYTPESKGGLTSLSDGHPFLQLYLLGYIEAKKQNLQRVAVPKPAQPVQPTPAVPAQQAQPAAPAAPAAKPAAGAVPATAQPAFKAGDRVSYPNAGIFTVAAVDGNKVTIKNSKGQTAVVDAKYLTKK